MMTYKMIFVVNGSLRMRSGKLAHCALDLYRKLIEKKCKSLSYWQNYGSITCIGLFGTNE